MKLKRDNDCSDKIPRTVPVTIRMKLLSALSSVGDDMVA